MNILNLLIVYIPMFCFIQYSGLLDTFRSTLDLHLHGIALAVYFIATLFYLGLMSSYNKYLIRWRHLSNGTSKNSPSTRIKVPKGGIDPFEVLNDTFIMRTNEEAKKIIDRREKIVKEQKVIQIMI